MISMRESISIIRRVQGTNSLNEKQGIIAGNRDNQNFTKLLFYACNPRLTYKVTMPTLMQEERNNPAITLTFTHIFEVCEFLASRRAIDDVTLYQVISFLEYQPEDERTFYRELLSKTLRLGVTGTSINKAIPGLIPAWNIQQAYPIDKYPIKNGTWFSVSQKLNGVRATYRRGFLIGKSGVEFSGFAHITRYLDDFPDTVFDGELTLVDKGGLSDSEACYKATGIINSDSEDKTEICYTIFDALPVEEFDHNSSKATYHERRDFLDSLAYGAFAATRYVGILPSLYKGTDQSVIPILLEQMENEDKEGLVVNIDVPYRCERHRGVLKVKQFYTMDLPILRCKEGTGSLVGTLGALIVDFQGNEVGVGGFTMEQRKWFWDNRDNVADTLVEVKYKKITVDKKTGERSLQFPNFVRMRTDKEEISYG